MAIEETVQLDTLSFMAVDGIRYAIRFWYTVQGIDRLVGNVTYLTIETENPPFARVGEVKFEK